MLEAFNERYQTKEIPCSWLVLILMLNVAAMTRDCTAKGFESYTQTTLPASHGYLTVESKEASLQPVMYLKTVHK